MLSQSKEEYDNQKENRNKFKKQQNILQKTFDKVYDNQKEARNNQKFIIVDSKGVTVGK